MKLADLLVQESIQMQQDAPPDVVLSNLPLQLRFLRHVRISVHPGRRHLGELAIGSEPAHRAPTRAANDGAASLGAGTIGALSGVLGNVAASTSGG